MSLLLLFRHPSAPGPTPVVIRYMTVTGQILKTASVTNEQLKTAKVTD